MSRTARKPGWIATGIIALAVLVPAVWVAPAIGGFAHGSFSGTTSQLDEGNEPHNLGLSVNRAKTKVTVVYFELEADPCKGTGGLQYAGLQGKIHDNGKFKALSPADGFYGYVKGRFHGQMADGTARYHFDDTGCESGVVTWQAHKG